jgi:hypothetical protein
MLSDEKQLLHYEKKFYRLAQKLDKIVLRYFKDSLIISNQNLHLTRNHPEYLGYWKPVIYSERISISNWLNILLSILSGTFYFLKMLISEMIKGEASSPMKFRMNDGLKLVVVSHFLGGHSVSDDLYYGDILNQLTDRDINFLKLIIPQSIDEDIDKIPSFNQSLILNSKLPNNFVLKYALMNSIAILKILYYGFVAKLKIYEILVIVLGQLNNFTNVKFAFNTERAIIDFKPDKLVMTFEGNALERLIFQACHKYGVEAIGFQHAPIIQSQYSIFRHLDQDLEPDTILASGEYTKKVFMNKLGVVDNCKVLGSTKNISSTINLAQLINGKILKILLIPDGNTHSVLRFLDLGLYLSKKLPSYKICIRAHPLFDKFLERKIFENHKKSSINHSIHSLGVELTESKWVIYENSSVAIQAGFFGCRLIYYANPFANVDPLFALNNKYIANNDAQIYEIVKNNLAFDILEAKKVAKFCGEYYSPLDVNKLLQ